VSLEQTAAEELRATFGAGAEPVTAVAPGRVTLVGEHVDYAGGRILAMAIDREVAVAARPSRDGRWHVVSRGRTVERDSPDAAGDIGDRVLGPAVVLGGIPPLEIVVVSSLPESAGLSSSAAVACAALVAMLRLTHRTLAVAEAVDVALRAERDVVGVPCGELDQRTIVEARSGHALLLDCAEHRSEPVPWPWDGAAVVVADSGEKHDVGAGGYRDRRARAEAVLDILRIESCAEIGTRWRDVPGDLVPVARHLAGESERVAAAVAALRAGDAARLGEAMNGSHGSLRDDYAVSTPRLDAMSAAARAVPGCHGARLVGAGFGGSAVALCAAAAAADVAAAMVLAAEGAGESWVVHPAPGLAESAADVITGP
jgi:galactokinase